MGRLKRYLESLYYFKTRSIVGSLSAMYHTKMRLLRRRWPVMLVGAVAACGLLLYVLTGLSVQFTITPKAGHHATRHTYTSGVNQAEPAQHSLTQTKDVGPGKAVEEESTNTDPHESSDLQDGDAASASGGEEERNEEGGYDTISDTSEGQHNSEERRGISEAGRDNSEHGQTSQDRQENSGDRQENPWNGQDHSEGKQGSFEDYGYPQLNPEEHEELGSSNSQEGSGVISVSGQGRMSDPTGQEEEIPPPTTSTKTNFPIPTKLGAIEQPNGTDSKHANSNLIVIPTRRPVVNLQSNDSGKSTHDHPPSSEKSNANSTRNVQGALPMKTPPSPKPDVVDIHTLGKEEKGSDGDVSNVGSSKDRPSENPVTPIVGAFRKKPEKPLFKTPPKLFYKDFDESLMNETIRRTSEKYPTPSVPKATGNSTVISPQRVAPAPPPPYQPEDEQSSSDKAVDNAPYPPLHWSVDVASRNKNEFRHVVFVKVHKAASTTLFNVFVRFALSRQLNVLFPRDTNIINERGYWWPLAPHPPSPPFLFDVLCNHVVFNESKISPMFPVDTQYIAILREPFSQMVSAFNYYSRMGFARYMNKASNFRDFIWNLDEYEPEKVSESFSNNRMAIDLGANPNQIRNASYINPFVQYLDHVFNLIMIAERFDESMVMLRRTLQWTTKDVLYVRLNEQPSAASNSSSRNTTAKEEVTSLRKDQKLVAKVKDFHRLDLALYDHFAAVLDKKIKDHGKEFSQELDSYKAVREMAERFCGNGDGQTGNSKPNKSVSTGSKRDDTGSDVGGSESYVCGNGSPLSHIQDWGRKTNVSSGSEETGAESTGGNDKSAKVDCKIVDGALRVGATIWSPGFWLSRSECATMQMEEVALLDSARYWQVQRLQPLIH